MKWLIYSGLFSFYIYLAAALSACAHVDEKKDVRTDEEIQAVFDQNKAQLYLVYQSFLRKTNDLQGKIVFLLTIEPSGQVFECRVHKSTFTDSAMGVEMCVRIQSFNFGPKNMDAISITYPIDFLPK